MDVLRGSALLLVVLNHAAALSAEGPGATAPRPVEIANSIAAPVRIPAMVFLSGLLVPASLAKGAWRYVAGKVRSIAWPYLVWSVVYFVVVAQPWLDENGLTLARFARYLTRAPSPLWFVGFLLCFYVLSLLLRRVPPWLLVLSALAASHLVPNEFRVERFLFLFAFFVLGDWMARGTGQWPGWLNRRSAVLFAVPLAGALAVVAAWRGEAIRYEALYAPVVLAAILLLAAGAAALTWRPLTAPLSLLGRQSIVVYLVHYPVIILGVAVFRLVPGAPDWLAFYAALACGLGGSLLVVAARRHAAVAGAFTAPFSLSLPSRASWASR
jgi:surface polysaccharide O-acyltransferase-like enzyme